MRGTGSLVAEHGMRTISRHAQAIINQRVFEENFK